VASYCPASPGPKDRKEKKVELDHEGHIGYFRIKVKKNLLPL
jgi:hypothetical protein